MDPWATLGVSRGASAEDIKSAYRKQAMKHHPDKGGNVSEFQKIQTAYDDITSGRADQPQPNPMGADPFGNAAHGFNPFGFSGFNPFGFNVQNGPMYRSEDLNAEYYVSLEDLYNGKNDSLEIRAPDGKIVRIDMVIQPGTPSNTRVRFSGANNNQHRADPRIHPGDVYINIMQRSHNTFMRENNDLIIKKDISVFDAMIGTTINIKSIDGRSLDMVVPPGTQPGTKLRLTGEGMPYFQRLGRGDLYVQLNIKVPKLNKEDLDKKIIDLM